LAAIPVLSRREWARSIRAYSTARPRFVKRNALNTDETVFDTDNNVRTGHDAPLAAVPMHCYGSRISLVEGIATYSPHIIGGDGEIGREACMDTVEFMDGGVASADGALLVVS